LKLLQLFSQQIEYVFLLFSLESSKLNATWLWIFKDGIPTTLAGLDDTDPKPQHHCPGQVKGFFGAGARALKEIKLVLNYALASNQYWN